MILERIQDMIESVEKFVGKVLFVLSVIAFVVMFIFIPAVFFATVFAFLSYMYFKSIVIAISVGIIVFLLWIWIRIEELKHTEYTEYY